MFAATRFCELMRIARLARCRRVKRTTGGGRRDGPRQDRQSRGGKSERRAGVPAA